MTGRDLIIALALALLTCALVPPLWHYRQVAEATKAELLAVERQLEPLRQAERRRTEERARLEQLFSQAGVLNRIQRSRTGPVASTRFERGRCACSYAQPRLWSRRRRWPAAPRPGVST